jgi:ribosomal protein S27AE
MRIIKATNIDKGTTIEGTADEVAEVLCVGTATIYSACRNGNRVARLWDVEILGDVTKLPEHARRLGLEKVCSVCGKTFLAARPDRMYCSAECGTKAEIERQKRVYPQKRKEEAERLSREKKNKKKKKDRPLTIGEISVLARKAGMSYGMYVQMKGL